MVMYLEKNKNRKSFLSSSSHILYYCLCWFVRGNLVCFFVCIPIKLVIHIFANGLKNGLETSFTRSHGW